MFKQLELFLEGKSEATQRTYRSLAKKLHEYLWMYRQTDIENVPPYLLKGWVYSFKSANSRASAKRFLLSYLRFLGLHEQLSTLKAMLREVKSQFKFAVDLTPHEIMQIINACYDTKFKLAVSLMGFNGLRVGEVLGLHWEDIDTERGTVRLLKRENERYGPKGMKPTDRPIEIPLNPISAKLYQELYKTTPSHEGRILNMSYKTFWKWFNRYLKASGVKREFKITPHKLRHAFAHTYLEAGGSIRKLQALLRHKKMDTTSIYTKPSLTELKQEFTTVMAQTIK